MSFEKISMSFWKNSLRVKNRVGEMSSLIRTQTFLLLDLLYFSLEVYAEVCEEGVRVNGLLVIFSNVCHADLIAHFKV